MLMLLESSVLPGDGLKPNSALWYKKDRSDKVYHLYLVYEAEDKGQKIFERKTKLCQMVVKKRGKWHIQM